MTADSKELVFEGLGVSPGIAVGPAHLSEAGAPTVPEYKVRKSDIGAEQVRFKSAVDRSGRQLRRLRDRARAMHGASGEDLSNLLDAYLKMLTGSRLVRGVERRIVETRINAESAVQAEISEIAHGFTELSDPYMAARADDIREAGARLIRNLTKAPFRAFSTLPQGSIVLAEEFSPADAALMDPRQVAGFATVLGGPEGHTAIMARSLGIPAVLGATGLTLGARDAGNVIIDGVGGRVIVNPTAATLREYEKRRLALRRETRRFARLRDLPAVTRDETEIQLSANVDLPQETALAMRHGAAGVGLLRSEYMFMNRETPPNEEEQYQSLCEIVAGMEGRPVTIRTLDVGGEKLAYSLGEQLGDAVNPALGLRAIRLSLKYPKLLEDQLAAILRVGAIGPIRILLPMIATTGEVRRVREAINVVARRLKRRRVPIADPLPPLGIMIEVPGAALAADALAQVSDFFAIGTNDLTMYTLAIDRADEQVAHLYNPLHPAVLRLIRFTAQAALRARIPFSLCGEIAGDPRYTALLLGLGVRDLSMSAGSLPKVKQRVRNLELTAATGRAQAIMEQADIGRIATLLDDFNALA
ncbi:MAG: phosphoenolpyruvate--protein phosphotransferase [Alphaproteobacteria bacterium]|nr:phosphoenolpyruvate--protein phosphotransferase [Alphaproteobacteria bacterium]